jgi:PAS domain S-box-containing protein
MDNTFGINIIPDNEQERLTVLKRYHILDTAAEEAFDNIARLAATMFSVPITLVSLVGEENVFFKANVGMGSAKSSARGTSISSLGILNNDITVFEDTTKVPCLQANPLVTGDFHLRFFAGAPLTTHDGYNIGTFCVADKQARTFSSADQILLKQLAKIVMDSLELRSTALGEIAKQATELEEQLRARKRIEAAEKQMESMVMNANTGMSIFRGRELLIEVANQPMYEIWGKTAEQVIGQPLLEVFPELSGQDFPELLVGIFDTGKPVINPEIPVNLVTPSGIREFFIDVSYIPIFDAENQVELLVSTVTDITEIVRSRKLLEQSKADQQAINELLKESNEELAVANEELLASNEELVRAYDDLSKATAKLTESESRFRNIIVQSPVAMMVTSGEHLVVEAINQVMTEILGKDLDLLNKPLFDVLPELGNQGFREKIFEVYRSGTPFYALEAPVKLIKAGKDHYRYFNIAYTPIWEEGRINAVLQVAIEVTDEIKNREELKNAEEMLRFAIDAANVGTWRINLKNNEFQCSDSFRQLFGYGADEEIILRGAMSKIAETHRASVYDTMDNAIKNGSPFIVEYPITGKREEQLRWLRAVGKVDQNAAGIPTHFSGVAFEITEQKQDELRKNDFIAMVSHELKTPLTSLKGYLQILISKNKTNTDNFTLTALKKGDLQVNKMTNLIEGFLNIAQMEAGKIHLQKTDFQFNELVEEVIEETKLLMGAHTIVVSSNLGVNVHADRNKIGQVINNLMSNAVKYSAAGTVIAIVVREDADYIELSVADQGKGISAAHCDKLFERFYRVENESHLNISGFGIGLYICAEIIGRHQGKIWVESTKGEGSTFHFKIPRYQFPERN